MMHPRYEVEREYAVRVMGTLTPEHQQSLLSGIALEDGPAKVEKIADGGGEGANHWYHLVLKEGRNREVRRLIESLGMTVSRLIRTRYGTIAMPSRLKRAQTLELTTEEVTAVLAAAGMRATGPMPQGQGRRDGERRGQGKGNGPRPPGHRPRGGERGDVEGNVAPRAAEAVDDDAPHDPDIIEPGNSAAGAPTHANRSVKSYFKNATGAHGRPHGKGAPRYGQGAHRAQGNGARPHGGKPGRGGPQGPGARSASGSARAAGASPYVTTTLTIPGGMPEGLPGTGGQRPKGGGQWANKGPQRPKGPPGPGGPRWQARTGTPQPEGRQAAGSAGQRQPRQRSARRAHAAAWRRQPGQPRAPRAGAPHRRRQSRKPGAHRADAAYGGRQSRERGAAPMPSRVIVDDNRGNEAPRPMRPVIADDDAGNR